MRPTRRFGWSLVRCRRRAPIMSAFSTATDCFYLAVSVAMRRVCRAIICRPANGRIGKTRCRCRFRPPLPTRYGDEIFIAGGQDQRGRPVKNVQAFNLKTGTWRQLPALPLAVTGGALGVLNDGLHFAGGFSKAKGKVLDSHNRLVGKRWQRRDPMPSGGVIAWLIMLMVSNFSL